MKKPSRVFAIFMIIVSSLVLCRFLWDLVSYGFGERDDGLVSVGVMVGIFLIVVPFLFGLYFGCRLLVHPLLTHK